MAKKFLFTMLFLTIIAISNIYAEEQTLTLPCPNGGNISLTINEMYNIPGGGTGGGGTLEYQNCSIFEGSLYNGTISVSFSFLPDENSLWIDFYKTDSFEIAYEGSVLIVAFPYSFSIELTLSGYQPKELDFSCDGCESPYILVNDEEFPLTKDILPYLIPLK